MRVEPPVFEVKTRSLPLEWSTIRGFTRLDSLARNVRLGLKYLAVTNTLAY
jgi:hypothetical protein